MFSWLTDVVSASPLTYLVVAAFTIVDVLGALPGETVIVAAVLVAMHGRLLVAGVGLATAVGAVAGDTVMYLLGRRVGDRVTDRLFRGVAAKERLRWAHRQMHRHGAVIIVAGRFVPMGRTVTTFAAATLDVDWRKFIIADVIAASLWASYWVGLTAIAGRAFTNDPWVSLLLSLGVGTALGGVAELVRRCRERKHRLGDDGEPASADRS